MVKGNLPEKDEYRRTKAKNLKKPQIKYIMDHVKMFIKM